MTIFNSEQKRQHTILNEQSFQKWINSQLADCIWNEVANYSILFEAVKHNPTVTTPREISPCIF